MKRWLRNVSQFGSLFSDMQMVVLLEGVNELRTALAWSGFRMTVVRRTQSFRISRGEYRISYASMRLHSPISECSCIAQPAAFIIGRSGMSFRVDDEVRSYPVVNLVRACAVELFGTLEVVLKDGGREDSNRLLLRTGILS